MHAAQFISDTDYPTLMGFSKLQAKLFGDEAYAEELRVGLRNPPPEEWSTHR